MDYGRIDHRRILRQHRAALHMECFDGSFATDSAARRGVEVALQALKIHLDVRLQLDGHRVPGLLWISIGLGTANAADLLGALKNAFREEETGGQFEIVA